MPGECNDESNDEGGSSALAWQVGDLTVICDSGAACHLSHSSTGMMNYRESNAYMRTASGARYPIGGYGDLPFTFRYSFVTDTGHTYTGAHGGDTVFFSTGDTLFFPSKRRLNFLHAYRPGMLVDETANATIAPGLTPSNRDTPVGINGFHGAHTHAHGGALRKTAKQLGITLEGKLHKYKGCLMAEGIRVSIPSKTNSRGDKKQSRVFVDLGGNKHLTSIGENKYPMIVRDDFSRYARLCFISYKSDDTEDIQEISGRSQRRSYSLRSRGSTARKRW